MSRTVKVLIGVLAAIVVVACVAVGVVWLLNRGDDGTTEDPLAGTTWQVRSYYNAAAAGGMASPLGGVQLTAEFRGSTKAEDSAVAGSAGCNTYQGSYTLDGDSLVFGPFASTMMFCGPFASS